jgi:hypothetical protein
MTNAHEVVAAYWAAADARDVHLAACAALS